MTAPAPDRGCAARFCARLALSAALVVGLAGMVWIERLFAPKAELWPRWQAHDPGSTETVDHGAWQRILGTYLAPGADRVNRFAYASLGPADRHAPDGYIARLAATPLSALGRPEQLAYWINLYNALTVQVVLDH